MNNKEKDLELFFTANYYLGVCYTDFVALTTKEKEYLAAAIYKVLR